MGAAAVATVSVAQSGPTRWHPPWHDSPHGAGVYFDAEVAACGDGHHLDKAGKAPQSRCESSPGLGWTRHVASEHTFA